MGTLHDIRARSALWLGFAALTGVVTTLSVTSVWRADAAPGDTDATYVPLPGCRLVDTRPATQVGPRGSKLGADQTMTVQVIGAQGECLGDLAIPDDTVGLATNVTIVDATARSNIRVYRGDLDTPPLLSNLNVTPGAPPTPNAVDVQLAPDGTINVYNFNGSVNVVIDVVGRYTDTSLKELADLSGTPGPRGPQGPPGPAGVIGPITMTHGLGPTQVSANSAPPKSVFVFSSVIRVVSNGGPFDMLMPLDGPATIGGRSYRPISFEYCIDDLVGNAQVSLAVLYSQTPAGLAGDSTARDSAGCYTVDTSAMTPSGAQGYQLALTVFGSLDAELEFTGVRSTWVPI